MKSESIAQKYCENLLAFSDLLKNVIEICIEEEVTTLGVAVIDEFKKKVQEIDIGPTILQFVKVSAGDGSFTVWKKIKKREEKYFKKNILTLVEPEYQDKIRPYIDLIDAVDEDGDLIINEDYRQVIWEYMESFVSLALKYVHALKSPALKKDEDADTLKKVYTKKIPIDIPNKDILAMAKLFKVDFEW